MDLIRQNDNSINQISKGSVNGARGIGYANNVNASGSAVGAASNNAGVSTSAGQAVIGGLKAGEAAATEGAKDVLNAATKAGGSGNLTDGDNSERDGWYDAKSLLDGTADNFGKEPPTEGGVLKVNSITGATNDAASRAIIVHLAEAAWSFVGPTAWTTPLLGPVDPSYTPGAVWSIIAGTGSVRSFGTVFDQMVSAAVATYTTFPVQCYSENPATSKVTGPPAPGNTIKFSTTLGANVGDTIGGDRYTEATYATGLVIGAGEYGLQDCGLSVGDTASCSATPPTSHTWDDLGVTQLAFTTATSVALMPYSYNQIGRFLPNPFDVNIPTEYGEGASILDLKTIGGDPIRIGATRDGGFYLYYRDPTNDNAPLGAGTANSVYLVGGNGIPKGFITPNELGNLMPI